MLLILCESLGFHRAEDYLTEREFQASCRSSLTASRLLLDDCDAWTLNASLTRLNSYRKCSKRRILGHSAQATSRLRIDGMTKCSRIARGFGSGSGTEFAAEVKPKAGLGFKANAAFLTFFGIVD